MMSFPQLFTPKAPAPGADPRYSLNILFNQSIQALPDYKALRQAVADTIDDAWGAGKSMDKNWLTKNKIKLPFRPTSDREYTGYDMPGGVFIAPWSKNKPSVRDVSNTQDILIPSEIWSGQLVRCSVHPFSYDQSGNKGVAFSLNSVQIVKPDMPRLDGRKAAKDEYTDLSNSAIEGWNVPAGDVDDRSNPPF
jgi:hypothetical protein